MRELTNDERIILTALIRAARLGEKCPTNEDLLGLLPERSSLSGIIKIMQRLEARGTITVERYQRSRRVTIVASGQSTQDPANKALHWRQRPRPKNVPAPSLTALTERKPELARLIHTEARKRGKAPQEFLCDLVWFGWNSLRDSDGPDPSVVRLA